MYDLFKRNYVKNIWINVLVYLSWIFVFIMNVRDRKKHRKIMIIILVSKKV